MTDRMRAVVWTDYGPPEVLQLDEVEKPTPKANEVLVRIHASTVTAGDCETRRMNLPTGFGLPMRMYVGMKKPVRERVLGHELAGTVEQTGRDVRTFSKGDEVFGSTPSGFGAHAEYVCLPEEGSMLAAKPGNMTFEEAAAVSVGGTEALHYLRKADIQRGEHVLIVGAGGTIGTFAVQLAKYYGAEVTGVDSTEKLDMLRSIGADQVVDYTREDFTERGSTYDVIFDVVGVSPYARCVQLLRRGGRYLLANPGLSQRLRAVWTSLVTSRKVVTGLASEKVEDLLFLRELIEEGNLKSVIDQTFPLEQAADAHRYVESGQKLGNVALSVVT